MNFKETMNLSGNNLATLTNLNGKIIELNSKNISSIDVGTFIACTNMIELGLYQNRLKSIKPDTFKNCINLTKIWLFENQIESISPKTFGSKLVELSLSSNSLTLIDEHMFEDCINMKKLWLNSNQINLIDRKSFKNCASLSELRLNKNNLQNIHPDTFSSCKNLTDLYLHDNNFNSLVIFSRNSLKKVTIFGEHTNMLKNIKSNNGGISIESRNSNSLIIEWNRDKIEDAFENLLKFDSNSEIFKYFLEFCLKFNLLFNLAANIMEKNNLAHLKYILKQNSLYKLFDINELRNEKRQTLLHIACDRGNHDTILALCQFNARGDIIDSNGKTPMQAAILSPQVNKQNLKILIDYGVNHNEALKFAESIGKKQIKLYIEQYGKERELNLKNRCKIKNIVFQGGSVKGIAYLGALRALTENKIIDIKHIRRVGGTSAGAITAALLGVGYTLDELEQILKNELKFKDLLDNTDEYKKKFFELKEQLGQMRSQELFVYFIKQLIKYNVKNPIVQILLGDWSEIDEEIFNNFGIFSGKKLRNFIDLWIKEKTKIPDATFEDIDKEIQAKGERCPFKHIYITGVDLITGKTFKFSHRHSPKMPIAAAVRISASIPLFFQPVNYEFKNQYDHKIKGLFVDGGVFDNYPLWMFDNSKYSNDFDLSEGHWMLNHETLGLRIVDKDLKSHYESGKVTHNLSRDSSFQNINLNFYLGALIKAFTKKQESDHHRQKDDLQRTIYIDSCDIDMLDFDLTDTQVENLINSGKKAVNEYCKRIYNLNTTTHHVRLSFSLLAALFTISKNSKSPVQDNNIYQLIKENIDKQSLNIPTVIYSFYSHGTLEEINYLKTLGLDIKMKNEHGNTVLHLAALKNDRVCIERIRNDLELVNLFSNLEQIKNNDNKVYTDLFPK